MCLLLVTEVLHHQRLRRLRDVTKQLNEGLERERERESEREGWMVREKEVGCRRGLQSRGGWRKE